MTAALSEHLPGTWELESRIDVTPSGERRLEPSLGDDPIALIVYDRSGHFAAQFMKRDRASTAVDAPPGAANNSRAQGGGCRRDGHAHAQVEAHRLSRRKRDDDRT